MEALASASQAAHKLKIDDRVTPSDISTMETASTDVGTGPAPDILFIDVKDVFAHVESTDGDAIVVGNVSATDFQILEQRRDGSGHKYRLFYLADSSCAIITVPTLEHEEMHAWLYQVLLAQMTNMGVWRDWRGTQGGKFPGPGGSSGEGDSGGHPRSKRRVGEWPTLVIEAGYTQTMPSLLAKMRWWFSASNHAVKVVILAKYFRSEPRIHIERWQEVVLRPGATATRWATGAGLSAPQLQCQQTVDVCWANAVAFAAASQTLREDPNSFDVVGGPLAIDFAAVFLRRPGGGEYDFVVDDSDLRLLATSVGERQ